MADGVRVIGDGPGRYFSLAGGTKSSWTLPPEQLDNWLASLETAKNARLKGPDLSSAHSISSRNMLSKSFAAELKKKSSATNIGDWAVRVHSDSGQV